MGGMHTLTLKAPPSESYLPVALAAAKAAAEAAGLDRREALRFNLVVEEIFCYLSKIDASEAVSMTFAPSTLAAKVRFDFRAAHFDPALLNANAVVHIDIDGEAPRDLGLLLAAKTADRLKLDNPGADQFHLLAEVDRPRPAGEKLAPPDAFSKPFSLVDDPDALLRAVGQTLYAYPAWSCPGSFLRPERFLDLKAEGVYRDALAVDAAGRPAGLLVFNQAGKKASAFSGPFVFAKGEDRETVAELVLTRFLEVVAREGLEIVYSERPTADVPAGWFETLGELPAPGACGPGKTPVLFRRLHEDMGGQVWTHPDFGPFLAAEYDRLALVRQLHPTPAKTPPRPCSLFAAEVDRIKSLASLKLVLTGEDQARNLAGQVAMFKQGGVAEVFYFMDLSRAEDAALHPALVQAGFIPRLILPHAGRSDLAVYVHAPA